MKQGGTSELLFQHKPRRDSEPAPDRAAGRTHPRLFIDDTASHGRGSWDLWDQILAGHCAFLLPFWTCGLSGVFARFGASH